jgi:site-specific DNA recombinase
MRVAVYARYSSEHQNERSIDDQVRLCREHAARLGWSVSVVYADYAISGAHLGSRPQAQAMLAAAKSGQHDIILAEALDRLSRDQEDIASIYKRLTFAGVRIVTVSEGEVNELHVGLKGTMNALFLRDLAAKVRRGQKGNIAAGKSAGGLSYGYDVVRELDAKGEPIRGQRVINPEQAEVVRRVYREYVSGLSARQIAHGLNRDGIPSPAGGVWRVSVINGNRARASGILWNDAYRGKLVYNRIRMIKDPETGKRISRPNPPEDWVCVDAPHLRIIDDATWEAVQAVKDRYSTCGARGERKPKHLLSGLLRCPVCGGAYTVYASDKAGCGTRRDAGTCSNDRTIIVSEAEQRVLSGMRSRLVHPKALAAFVTTYEDERKRLRADREQQMHRAKTRLAEAEKQIDNIIDAVANGFATESMKKRLMDAEAEAAALRQQIAAAPPENVIALHPAAIAEYRRNVEHLFDALKADDIAKAEASTLLRAVIDHIDVVPLEGRGKYDLKVVTRLETLIGLAQGAQADRFVSMVAEEGFEPPTPGL